MLLQRNKKYTTQRTMAEIIFCYFRQKYNVHFNSHDGVRNKNCDIVNLQAPHKTMASVFSGCVAFKNKS